MANRDPCFGGGPPPYPYHPNSPVSTCLSRRVDEARVYFLVAFGSSVPIHWYAFLNHEPISSVSLRRPSGTDT